MNEIRWHARAGQGAKTASQLFALAALRSGRYAQAFPEYGPERRGAPLRAFTRIDDVPIRRHDSVEQPDVVVVLEPSVVQEVDVAEGLTDDGLVLLNA
jgi:pyruvate ferredoxin oxidoreductase gamma subunit